MYGKHLTALGIALLTSALSLGAWAADEKPSTHVLPREPKAAVIILDSKGGMLRRVSADPVLQVNADGSILVGDPYGAGRKVEGTLTAEELQTLLGFILDQQQLAKITPDDLKMKAMMAVSDGITTVLTVNADDAAQQLSGYAVEMVAQQNGADSAAARFIVITKKLYGLADLTRLGGRPGLEKLIAAANTALKAQHPAEGQLVAGELKQAYAPAAGGAKAVFAHKVILSTGKWHMVWVTVTQPASGDATVSVQKGSDQPG